MADATKTLTGIDVNMLLPGGATNTGMIPEAYKQSFKEQGLLLSPDVMHELILFLTSEESNGVTGERIAAKDFATWKQALRHSKT